MKEQSNGEVLTIGVDCKADLTAEGIDVSADGTAFDMLWQGKRYPVHLHTPGRFSVYNALGAAGACILLGVPVEEIVAGLTANPAFPADSRRYAAKGAVRQLWIMHIRPTAWKMC